MAINLPESVKENLSLFRQKWPDLPARWTKKENLHLTLVFLGYLSDEEVLRVCELTKQIAASHKHINICLNKIFYGPPKKLPPRMIWVECDQSDELIALRKDLERSLFGEVNFSPQDGSASSSTLSSGPRGSPQDRVFSFHITLARIKTWEWRKIDPEERPDVNEELSLSFGVNSVEVMESRLKRGGAEYSVLESAPLGSSG